MSALLVFHQQLLAQLWKLQSSQWTQARKTKLGMREASTTRRDFEIRATLPLYTKHQQRRFAGWDVEFRILGLGPNYRESSGYISSGYINSRARQDEQDMCCAHPTPYIDSASRTRSCLPVDLHVSGSASVDEGLNFSISERTFLFVLMKYRS